MTETEEVRRLLDERGVRWIEATPSKTKWYSPVLNGPVAVSEWNGKLVLDAGYVSVTPEQAIAATLSEEKAGRKSPPEGGPGPCGQPSDDIIHDAATLGDDEYESRMDELLCRLTNGMWSKSRSYSVDFMVCCIDEAYEEAYSGDSATLGRGECELKYHIVEAYGDADEWTCLSCGEQWLQDTDWPTACPWCGKAVRR